MDDHTAHPFRLLCECGVDCGSESLETLAYDGAEMNAHGAPATRLEHRQIASRLGGDDDPKAVLLARNREVDGVIRGNLQKDASVRSALVVLSGGVEKTRAESEAGGYTLSVAHFVP